MFFIQTKKWYNNKGGYTTLISVLVVGAVGISITTSLLLLGLGSSRSSFAIEQLYQSKTITTACAEEALQQIKDSPTYTGNGGLIFTAGECSYTVVNNGGQNRTITSSSKINTIISRVKIIINATTPNINIVSWQEVSDF